MTAVVIHREYGVDKDDADMVSFSMTLPESVAPTSANSMRFELEYVDLTATAQRRGKKVANNPQTDFMTMGSGYSGKPLVEWSALGKQRYFLGWMKARFDWTDGAKQKQFAEAYFDAGHKLNESEKVTLNALPGTELSIIAEYSMPWDGNPAAEIQASNAGRWHPGTVSFETVADTPNRGMKRTVREPASDVDTMMGAILKYPDNSLMRVNLFSHGGPGLISLKGSLDTTTNQIMMEQVANDANGYPIAGGIDKTVFDWYNDDAAGQQYRSMIRAKFRDDAEFLLFLCNGASGVGVSLAMELSYCFNVTVLAYDTEIGYYTDDNGSKILDRNLTSLGLIKGKAQIVAAEQAGTIKAGYPCAVKVPSTVPSGDHVQPIRRPKATTRP